MPIDSTIDNDVLDMDGAADALLAKWGLNKDGNKPKKEPEPKAEEPEEEEVDEPEEEPEEEDESEPSEGDDEEEEDEEPASSLADDDHEVVVKVGDKETKVKVGDLKRLYGQEASLTQKSQALAEAHRMASEQAQKHVSALDTLKNRAEEAFKPYSQIDWEMARSQVTPEQFVQLRENHNALKAQVEYFNTELDGAKKASDETRHAALQAQGKVCLDTLNDKASPYHIPEFGQKIYDDLRAYAVKNGASQRMVDELVDPVAWKTIHKAYMYDQGSKAAVKKLTSAPKNVAPKSGNNAGTGTQPNKAKAQKALSRLAKTGSRDDAAAALLARWQDASAE